MPRDRSERIGIIVSAVLHLGAILWLLLGGIFFSHEVEPTTITTEVSLISSAEYDAMVAAAPTAPVETPAQPSLPEPIAAEEPAPQPTEEPTPETVTPEPPVAEPVPDAAPEALEEPDTTTIVADTPPTPPQPPVEEPSEFP